MTYGHVPFTPITERSNSLEGQLLTCIIDEIEMCSLHRDSQELWKHSTNARLQQPKRVPLMKRETAIASFQLLDGLELSSNGKRECESYRCKQSGNNVQGGSKSSLRAILSDRLSRTGCDFGRGGWWALVQAIRRRHAVCFA